MGLCTENLRWRRGREAGPGDISSTTGQWKEKPTSWTWIVISCALPKILMQCNQAHHMALCVCWLLHSLESCPTPSQTLSSCKPLWLRSGAETPDSSLPGVYWDELGILLEQHSFPILETWGSFWQYHTFSLASQEMPSPDNPTVGGQASHAEGNWMWSTL